MLRRLRERRAALCSLIEEELSAGKAHNDFSASRNKRPGCRGLLARQAIAKHFNGKP
jgi:hypothetical protein